jgi:hypothetical protein
MGLDRNPWRVRPAGVVVLPYLSNSSPQSRFHNASCSICVSSPSSSALTIQRFNDSTTARAISVHSCPPAREWSCGDASDIDGQTGRSKERERMSQNFRSWWLNLFSQKFFFLHIRVIRAIELRDQRDRR